MRPFCPTCGDYISPIDGDSDYPEQCERCRELAAGSHRDEMRPRPRRRRRPDPPKRKSRIGLILGLVGASFFLFCIGGCGLFWYVFLHEIEEPVTAADKEVMITGQYVASFSKGMPADPNKDKYTKVRHVDGSREMTYEYGDADDTTQPLYVIHTVAVERNAREAGDGYAGLQFGTKIAMAGANNVQEVERNDLWSWGDRSRCVVLHSNGKPYGHIFTGLKGKRFFILVISGVYFTKAEDIKAFLDPMLKKMDSYEG